MKPTCRRPLPEGSRSSPAADGRSGRQPRQTDRSQRAGSQTA
jgi:hypothetical protein